ncbi:MAG: hypothetical protein GTO02_09770 [Candidatus Dadabacteria bacterium]|nr:hypothetical protein [Candidatus Dadabacteria bacterium]
MERMLNEEDLCILEQEQKNEDAINHPLFIEIEQMKKYIANSDIEMLRSYLKNNPRKVYRLHDQYEEQIEHLPRNNPLRMSIDQVLGILQIPYAKVVCRD